MGSLQVQREIVPSVSVNLFLPLLEYLLPDCQHCNNDNNNISQVDMVKVHVTVVV